MGGFAWVLVFSCVAFPLGFAKLWPQPLLHVQIEIGELKLWRALGPVTATVATGLRLAELPLYTFLYVSVTVQGALPTVLVFRRGGDRRLQLSHRANHRVQLVL